MGRDLTLYTAKGTKKDLSDYLEELGFEKCEHLWDWPKGTLNYSWFDHQDFKSIDGVSANILPTSKNERSIAGNSWALQVRNLYSASAHDVKMLNQVLRGARKKFGGTIKGDYGTNRYAPIEEDTSTPISRGVSKIYLHIKQEMEAVKFALPEASIKIPESPVGKIDNLIELTKSVDPSRVIYNGLVPFAVSMFEYFFAQTFQVLIAYDVFALKKRESYNAKFEFSDVLDLHNNDRTIESLIAQPYTFQNLNQLNKAYKDWLKIDVRNILYKRKRIGKSVKLLENRISEIIQYRHGIVHRFQIDRKLTRADYISILDAISIAMTEFTSFLEKKYHFKIDQD